jgi:lipoprotein signal peptidase
VTQANEHILVPSNSPAWRSPRAWTWLLVTIALSFVADIVTKYIAFHNVVGVPVEVVREQIVREHAEAASRDIAPRLYQFIPQHQPVVVVPKLLEFTLVLNPGAVFGIGAGKRWFFIVFTGLAIGIGLYVFVRHLHARDRLMHVALGLVLGGGLGNLYDRVIYACVRDFIHPLPGVMYPFGWKTPWSGREVWPYVSNVADALLIVGVIILAWRAIKMPPETTRR